MILTRVSDHLSTAWTITTNYFGPRDISLWPCSMNSERPSPIAKPPDDLMRVNLYINNTRDNLRVRVDQSAASFHQHKLIKGYKHFYKTMTEALSKFINDGKCLSTHKITDQDDENERNKLEAIKKLINKSLPELYELNKALSILEANRQQLETIFEATLGDEMYLDFKPDRLLFLSLVDLDSEYLRMVSVDKGQTKNNSAGDEKIILDDSLMVSKVRTSYQFGDRSFASITDLLILVRPIFHQDYVISFQQHVMAAALQPVSMCLGEYLSALKRLVDADTTKQDRSVIIMYDSHTDKLRTGAQDLCKHLNSLINLEMFPESVQEYLKYMSNETSEVIEFINGYSIISDDTRSEFTSGVINLIIEKISQSMRLSHMKFMINVKSFSFVDRDDVAKVLIGLNDKIKKIGAYVANLERYKYMFLRGLKIYDHKNMFVTQNVDIQNTKHLGYKVVKNDLDNPPIIQLI
ncbi:uncharacterized protein LOC126836177 [Adelges cooleyi]|uniref:uncharacterized protein LOC126836177 n=1 Tax=Adelges cooleyi TaxID=133065 RepID=UPI0021802678|nr:uncharacterized protein LOC126836177 [Adelges cooleyi]